MSEKIDPEELPAVEKIRYAEALIREHHKVLDPDWMFWREVADHLNVIANSPGGTNERPSDRRVFNRAQDMATGYIRMSRGAVSE